MEKVRVVFTDGVAKDGVHDCNLMIGDTYDQDGNEVDLYAEVITPSLEDLGVDSYEDTQEDYEMYGYEELKAEIIKQAKEIGISEENLEFC